MGVRVDDATVKVISTPNRFDDVTIELNIDSVGFLMTAAPVCTYEPPSPFRVEHERPDLEEGNVKWMRMGKVDVLSLQVLRR